MAIKTVALFLHCSDWPRARKISEQSTQPSIIKLGAGLSDFETQSQRHNVSSGYSGVFPLMWVVQYNLPHHKGVYSLLCGKCLCRLPEEICKSLQKVLDSMQRPTLLSLCKAYATTPTSTLCVIAEIMPSISLWCSRQYFTACTEGNFLSGETLSSSWK